jgi:hypothetical protein
MRQLFHCRVQLRHFPWVRSGPLASDLLYNRSPAPNQLAIWLLVKQRGQHLVGVL